MSRRKPTYGPETQKMYAEGKKRGVDFSNPLRYATKERAWIRFKSIFYECLLVGDSTIQHQRRIPKFIWDWHELLNEAEPEGARRLSTLIQSLLEDGPPSYLKCKFGGWRDELS